MGGDRADGEAFILFISLEKMQLDRSILKRCSIPYRCYRERVVVWINEYFRE